MKQMRGRFNHFITSLRVRIRVCRPCNVFNVLVDLNVPNVPVDLNVLVDLVRLRIRVSNLLSLMY